MMNARTYYFKTLEKITHILSNHSDLRVAALFNRLDGLFDLMDIKTIMGEMPKVDDHKSGFPILKEVISVSNDYTDFKKNNMINEINNISNEIVDTKNNMLDDMLIRKKVPNSSIIQEMARLKYMKELFAYVNEDKPIFFLPNAFHSFEYAYTKKSENDLRLNVQWTYWDGTTSQPVMVFCHFTVEDINKKIEIEEEIETIKKVANNFSGIGFSPLTLASEIDETSINLRLKKLSKITVVSFITEFFSKVEDEMLTILKTIDDIENAWAIRWCVDNINSGSTYVIKNGLFSKKIRQKFIVDTLDPDCASRSVSSFEKHIAMPHQIFQAISNKKKDLKTLKNSNIHVISDIGNLTENV